GGAVERLPPLGRPPRLGAMPGGGGTVHDVATRRLPLFAVVVATALALAAALAVVAVLGDDEPRAGGTTDGYEMTPAGELPDSVGDVRLVALDGGPDRALGELLGTRPVVVNFFASWCAPCVEEMPAFERVHQELGDQVRFVGVNRPDRPEDAGRIIDRTGITYEVVRDPGGLLESLEGLVMPTTALITADGQVVRLHSGPMNADQLRTAIDEELLS